MTTRSQIEFRNEWKNDKGEKRIERRTIYRHSDGYLEGVIPDLKEFLKWNNGRNSDVEYQAANFIYWSKRRNEEQFFNKSFMTGKTEDPNKRWSDTEPTNISMLHTGFGVCNNDEFHGDIEYFYEVISSAENNQNIIIKCYEVGEDKKKKEDFKLLKTIKVKI